MRGPPCPRPAACHVPWDELGPSRQEGRERGRAESVSSWCPLAASAIAICLERPCTRPFAMVRFIPSRLVITGSFTNPFRRRLAVKARTVMSRCDPRPGGTSLGRRAALAPNGIDEKKAFWRLGSRIHAGSRARSFPAGDVRVSRSLTSRFRHTPGGGSAPPTSQGQLPSRSHSTVEMIRLDRPSASSTTRRASSRARPMQ